MSPGVGYISMGDDAISYPNSYTASFSGSAFNNGNINTSVSLGTATFVGADDDWNLLGNPYPSAIDSELFTAANTNLNGTIYYWTHATADSAGDNIQADYAMYNTTGGTGGGSQYIASGQGFFIQANTAGTATFTNAMRVAGNNLTFYKTRNKKAHIKEKDRVWLSLSTKTNTHEILIGFFENATDGFDRLYDGLKLDSGLQSNFYSLLDGKEYGIQGKSFLDDIEEVSLGFKISDAGNFTITINAFEGKLNSYNIYLIDNFLGVQHDLKLKDYTFSMNETGVFNNRFKLMIINKVLSNSTTESSNTLIIKQNNDALKFYTSNKAIIKKISIYDMLGKEILTKENVSSEIEIRKKSLKFNSIYILKTILENGEVINHKLYNH